MGERTGDHEPQVRRQRDVLGPFFEWKLLECVELTGIEPVVLPDRRL
jgi:hypothetical protein